MTFETRLSRTRTCRCLAARKRARTLTRRYDDALRPHGLRCTQFSVLAVLGLKGPTGLGEVAEILGLEASTLSRNANLMERDGWIDDAPSEDERERRLRLTHEGRIVLEAALPAWEKVQDRVDDEPS